MKFYPIALDINGQRVTVIGGGVIAERKIESLIAHGANVTVIAPEVTDRIAALGSERRIDLLQRHYKFGDCRDAFVVIAATDDVEVQERVWREAVAAGQLINTVDEPSRCNFIMPAVVQDGDITVTISTGGKSPALAAKLRKEIADVVSQYDGIVDTLAEIRLEIRRRVATPEKRRELHLKILELVDEFEVEGNLV